MSRIGESPVTVPAGVEVKIAGSSVTAKGKLGELAVNLPSPITAKLDAATLMVLRPDDTRQSKSFHGLARSLVANMIEGVANGYKKELEIVGVGFKGAVQGQTLTLTIGYSSPIEFVAPQGITIEVQDNTKLTVKGADKQQVGQAAARIRGFFPAEPYKGKGIQYKGERVRRKVGKTVA